jgi:hypothetical protein
MSNVPPYTFGLLEKRLSFRIMANAAWTSPVAVAGRGSSAIIAGAGNAIGVTSVARTAAGKYTIQLDDAYAKLVTAQATYQGSGDAEDISAQIGVIANVGTSTPVTIVVKTKTGTVNTDPATTDVNTSINVDLVFEDSGA